jgi:hypothetical protein
VVVCTLGDLLLDVIVRLDSQLAPGDDVAASTRLAPGGQAANVAAWAADLGARARIVAVQADDDAGAMLRRELEARGVELAGPLGRRTGIVVSLVQPEGDRTMASDRGSAPELHEDDLEAKWLECDALHLSGYSLMRAPIAGAAVRAATLAREHGAGVSVDLSSWTHITRFRDAMRDGARRDPSRHRLRQRARVGGRRRTGDRGMCREARAARDSRRQATSIPRSRPTSWIRPGPATRSRPASSWAGPQLALEAAARCVARVGAMP